MVYHVSLPFLCVAGILRAWITLKRNTAQATMRRQTRRMRKILDWSDQAKRRRRSPEPRVGKRMGLVR